MAVTDPLRDDLVEERVPHLFGQHHIPPPRFRLQRFQPFHQFPIVFQERTAGFKFPFDQGMVNKEFARQLGFDVSVLHPPARCHHQAEQQHFFVSHHRRSFFVPVRFAVVAINQVLGEWFDPGGIDPCDGPQELLAGLDLLSRDNPFGFLREDPRAGPELHFAPAPHGVLVGFTLEGHV